MPRPFLCVVAAILVVTSPLLAPAATPKAPATPQLKKVECHDVLLTKQGLLTGQLVDAQGKPIAGGAVWLLDGRREPVAAQTSADGRFGYRDLRPGVYSLQSGDAVRVCRVWPSKAAPPKSLPSVLLVADEAAVRGQMGPPPMLNGFVQGSKKFFASPLGLVTIGAAIATPIAIVAADDDNPATP